MTAEAGTRRAYLLLGAAVACISLGSIFVRLAAAPALAVAFHRVALASLVLLPFAGRSAATSWGHLPRRSRLLLLASGGALALHFATWISSLSYTSVAASVLLVNMTPLFTIVLSRVFLQETPTPLVLAATGGALVGAGLIAYGDWGGAQSLRGVALALAGAATLAVYHVIGRGLRAALPLDAYILCVWGSAAVTLLGLALLGGVALSGFPPATWAAFVALALLPTIAGHGLVNRSLRHLPAPTVGLFLLGEPIGATALAYAVFGEVPGAWTLLGGTVIVASLAVVVLAPPPR